MLCLILLIILTPLLSQCQLSNDPDELLNWCLDSKNHKSKPGPEAGLYDQCTPWKQKSCCTYNTTRDAHHTNMYNFNYNHCGHIKNMSTDCRRHFLQDLCFYECSPNIGPWTVKVDMKVRKQRFVNVPLCQSDCNGWFEACIDDYTCTDNWIRNFDWSKSGNKCPVHGQCKTFKEIYGTAENFCQKVWDSSWAYTSDDLPCMRIWFNGTNVNPNEYVAKLKVKELTLKRSTVNWASSGPGLSVGLVLVSMLALITWL